MNEINKHSSQSHGQSATAQCATVWWQSQKDGLRIVRVNVNLPVRHILRAPVSKENPYTDNSAPNYSTQDRPPVTSLACIFRVPVQGIIYTYKLVYGSLLVARNCCLSPNDYINSMRSDCLIRESDSRVRSNFTNHRPTEKYDRYFTQGKRDSNVWQNITISCSTHLPL